MKKRHTASYILAVCALIIVILVIRKAFFTDTHTHLEPVRTFAQMDTLDTGGISTGPENAEVTIIKFFDYECPYCKKLQKSIDEVREKYESRLEIKYVHFPLRNHQNAVEAAIAAECAHTQHRFSDAHDYLFQHQTGLDSVRWEEISQSIGIPDRQAFLSCIEYQEPFLSVEKGIAAARQLGISSIPTFLINGRMYQGGMPADLLEGLVEAELE